jgi:hypothetical protein
MLKTAATVANDHSFRQRNGFLGRHCRSLGVAFHHESLTNWIPHELPVINASNRLIAKITATALATKITSALSLMLAPASL